MTATINPEALRQNVRDIEQRAADCRAKLQRLVQERTNARGVLASAIAAWSGVAKVSAEQNARDYIASEQAERQRLAKFGPRVSTESQPGNSYIDRAAFAQKGGDASDHVRSQMRSGYRRGSWPASQRGTKLQRV